MFNQVICLIFQSIAGKIMTSSDKSETPTDIQTGNHLNLHYNAPTNFTPVILTTSFFFSFCKTQLKGTRKKPTESLLLKNKEDQTG